MKRDLRFGLYWIFALALLASWGLLNHSAGLAQEPAGAEPAPAAAQPEPDADQAESGGGTFISPESIGGLVVKGGVLNIIFFSVLGIFSIWAAAVTLERLVHLRRHKVSPPSFSEQLKQMIETNQDTVENYRMVCASSATPVSRILECGIDRAGRPVPEIEKAMEDAAAHEMAILRTKNRPLSVVASVAPLIGLLGTVVGITIAFYTTTTQAGGGNKGEALFEGIYLALMTTAAGLTIAIPCLLLFSWFNTRAERYMWDIDRCLTRTIPSFVRFESSPVDQQRAAATSAEEASPAEPVATT